ncbi:MAG: iron-containing alcohol dehydrogenase [Candidatus Latescibacterota bacterium]
MPLQIHNDFRHTTHVLHGAGAILRLPEFFHAKAKVLIVTDKGLEQAGIAEKIIAVFDSADIPHAVYNGAKPNPAAACVHAGQRLYAKEKCNALLALGGGSPMDVAKMIGVVATNGGRINDYLGSDKIKKNIPSLSCVPTTYGTGSEVTPFAVLTNPKTQNKDPVISARIAPQVAILDPNLSVALPAFVGGPTGMDALTHAIESYTNLMAGPVTDGLALQAIRLIGENLRLACANDCELAATENMLVASMLAGMAFAQTRLGNVHAMSHPVGAQFGVHHGLANAILLPYIMDFNLTTRLGKFAAVAEALGADTLGLNEREAAQLAIDTVWELNQDLAIPAKLSEVGVKKSGIRALAKATMQSGNIAVNPRKTSQLDIETIFRKAI